MTEIILKQGVGEPSDSAVEVAELAIDSSTGDLYSKLTDGTIKQLNAGGGGAGMVISESEPKDPVDGMQWLESTTAKVWIYDDGKWLEFPSASIKSDVIGEEGETIFKGHFMRLTGKPTREDDDDDDEPFEGGRILGNRCLCSGRGETASSRSCWAGSFSLERMLSGLKRYPDQLAPSLCNLPCLLPMRRLALPTSSTKRALYALTTLPMLMATLSCAL